MLKLVHGKTFFLFLVFFFAYYILHTTYHIPAAHAAIREIPDCDSLTTTPVTADVEPQEKYVDTVSNAIIYPEINQGNENNSQKDKVICAGISQQNWLASILPSFVCSLVPILGYCPQAVSLGTNTVLLYYKTSTFKDANLYPDLQYEPQPYRKEVIDDPEGSSQTIGNSVISEITNWIGRNPGSYMTAGFPTSVQVEDNPTPINLVEKLNEEDGLTQVDKIETERTGQYDPACNLNFSGMFYPGVTIAGFEDCVSGSSQLAQAGNQISSNINATDFEQLMRGQGRNINVLGSSAEEFVSNVINNGKNLIGSVPNSQDYLGRIYRAALSKNINPLAILSIWGVEQGFGFPDSGFIFGCGVGLDNPPRTFDSQLECSVNVVDRWMKDFEANNDSGKKSIDVVVKSGDQWIPTGEKCLYDDPFIYSYEWYTPECHYDDGNIHARGNFVKFYKDFLQ